MLQHQEMFHGTWSTQLPSVDLTMAPLLACCLIEQGDRLTFGQFIQLAKTAVRKLNVSIMCTGPLKPSSCQLLKQLQLLLADALR